jgi:hypothetical protein
MRVSAVISACILLPGPTLALADPTGTYNVVARNADNGSTYKGTVEVSRMGATHKVVWNIDGESVGTGLGSHFENGGKTIVTGPRQRQGHRPRRGLRQQGFVRHRHLLPAARRIMVGRVELWGAPSTSRRKTGRDNSRAGTTGYSAATRTKRRKAGGLPALIAFCS